MESTVAGNAVVLTVDKAFDGKSVEELLTEGLQFPTGFLRELLQDSRIWIQQQPAKMEDRLRAGQRVRLIGGVDEQDDSFGHTPNIKELEVLYEDAHVLVVNKPAGLLIYPGSPKDTDTLGHRVATYFMEQGVARKVRHVHRLDRDTTGAVLYAKHAFSARTFDALLTRHAITRTYLTVVAGRLQPPKGVIEAGIGRDRHVAGKFRVSQTGKDARTFYRTLATSRQEGWSASLLACVLDTGRTHQIRVHMASRGAPVVGDILYGSGHGLAMSAWPMGYALHAASLQFTHPYFNEIVRVEAPVPSAFRTGLDALLFPSTWETEAEKAIQHAENIRG